ncbi:MAG: fibronectin type III domain-containing protein [Elusimicrobia bacterium]|nr:fibronectin type III domain-containing protein [Elusimicrobiota bacterium]
MCAAAFLLSALPARAASQLANPRFAAASARLPNGNVIIVGGIVSTGPVVTATNSVEILDAQSGGSLTAGASMSVARASATITVLPDGNVLVTGGWNQTSGALNSAEIYISTTNTWVGVANTMTDARYDHTATLLNDGTVLICGGHTNTAGNPDTNSCDLFTPAIGNPGAGTFSHPAGIDMTLGRELQTATLLNDGSVWIAGGYNENASGYANGGFYATTGSSFVVTTERYYPSLGSWQQTAPLNIGRAYHTATLTGDNKVLIVGGFNDHPAFDANGYTGANGLGSTGPLASTELYDPTGGSIVPGAPTLVRLWQHAAVLDPSGEVDAIEGRGNIEPSDFTGTIAFGSGSTMSGTFVQDGDVTTPNGNTAYSSSHTATSGSATAALTVQLNPQVTGTIIDGDIQFTSPYVLLNGGYAFFTSASTSVATSVGLRLSLNNVKIGCDPTNTTSCGYATGDFPFTNVGQGSYGFTVPLTRLADLTTTPTASGAIHLSADSTPGSVVDIVSGTITTQLKVTVPSFLAGFDITSATITLDSADTLTFAESSSYTATLTLGTATVTGSFPVDGSGVVDFGNVTFGPDISGTIQNVGQSQIYYATSTPSGVSIPVGGAGNARVTPIEVSLQAASNGIDLDGATLKYAKATYVIRDMIFSDAEYYDPKNNQWSFNPANGKLIRPLYTQVAPVADLLPNGDEFVAGGMDCGVDSSGNTDCSTLGPSSTSYSLLANYPGFSNGSAQESVGHAYHSATLLADGTILVAGGTDGTTVLQSAATFDPVAAKFTPTTGSMTVPREQHSATLLPDGRVLLAGGFTTTAGSTSPTNTAELYFPDQRSFAATPPMISSHSQATSALLPDGDVLVAGGFSAGTTATKTAEIYVSTSNVWMQVADMPSGRADAASVLLQNGKIAVFGGTDSSGVLGSVVVYDPATNTWSTMGNSMPTALHGETATLMPNGDVLVAGGNDGFGESAKSYLYNPGSDTWSATKDLNYARFEQSATLLPNGDVMMTGGVQEAGIGSGSSNNALQQVEYYHPNSRVWTYVGANMSAPRAFDTATLAPDGYLYFIGGANGSIGASQTASFYTSYDHSYFTAVPDNRAVSATSLRQSSITAVTASPLLPGDTFNVTGLRFRGGTEASGGAAGPPNSSFSSPRLLLQRVGGADATGSESGGDFIADLTQSVYNDSINKDTLNTSLTAPLPATTSLLPYGWYMTWVGNNDVHTVEAPMVQIGPAKPSAAPTWSSSTVLGTSSITWTWGAVAGSPDGYDLYQSSSGLFISTVSATPAATYYSFTETGLQPNATSGLLIAAYTMSGDGPLWHSATTYTLPLAPTGLSISSVVASSLYLFWNPNGNVTGTVYEVSMSTDQFFTTPSTPVPTSFLDTTDYALISNLAPSTTYWLRVRAFNASNLASDFSTSISTLTRTPIQTVIGTAVSSTTIQWNWADPGGVTYYNVYNTTTSVFLASPTVNSFTDPGLDVNTQRSVEVQAVNAGGGGPLTVGATIYTLANPPSSVALPTIGLTTGSVVATWLPNANPLDTLYTVKALQLQVSTSAAVLTSTTGFTADITGLSPASLVTVIMFAQNGNAVRTSTVSVSTYTLAATPSNLAVTQTTPISVSVAWNSNNNTPTAYYELTYSTDDFATDVSTFLAFSAGYDSSTATVTGLLTSTTYWFRVRAENPYGQVTAFSNTVSSLTYNGGAPAGSIAGTLTALGASQIQGSLAGGRTIDLRSPGGAFPQDVSLLISSYDASTPFCPHGLNVAISLTETPEFQPSKPVFLTVSYLAAELGGNPTSQIALMRYVPGSVDCVPLSTTFDAAGQTFTAQLNHFSLYELVATPLSTSADSARIFPNPYRAAHDAYVTIDHVPPYARIRVMTLQGITVFDQQADGSGILIWQATNGVGRSLASGLYLVVVESGSTKKIMKLAVIR